MSSDLYVIEEVVRNTPGDRTARAAYADELLAVGDVAAALAQRVILDPENLNLRLEWAAAAKETEPLRSELCELRVRLALIPPRTVIEGAEVLTSHGPRYWSFSFTGDDKVPYEAGARIDFPAAIDRRLNRIPKFGLRVSKCEIEDDTSMRGAVYWRVVVVEDEHSGPDRRNEWTRRADQLQDQLHQTIELLPKNSDHPGWYRPVYRFGFIDTVVTTWSTWAQAWRDLFQHHPIAEVILQGGLPICETRFEWGNVPTGRGVRSEEARRMIRLIDREGRSPPTPWRDFREARDSQTVVSALLNFEWPMIRLWTSEK